MKAGVSPHPSEGIMPRFFAFLLLMVSAVPVAAQTIDHAREYRECMALARERPRQAFERAGQWRGLGGGAAAEHCRAVALLELGEPAAAAALLEETAQDSRESAAVKAGLLRQAAEAWRRADQMERAEGVLDAALRVLPESPDVLEDRALLRVERGRLWEAVDDLNVALEIEPRRVSALVLRAAAYRRLGALDLARDDLSKALALDPGFADSYVERGHLRLAAGDRDGARKDWLHALRLAPDGPAAEAARANLEKLDVRVDG